MSIKIIDDFANVKEQLEIINYINNNNLLYSFNSTSITNKKFMTSNTIDYPQIVHEIIRDDEVYNNVLFSYIYTLLFKHKLSNNFIHRIKINTTFPYPKNNKKNYGPIHTDISNTNVNGTSIIYYINNSDGDTFFFDDKLNVTKRITPRQGRAIIFDNKIKHTACCPINSTYRQVINMVLYK
jgi:hypothetical protein